MSNSRDRLETSARPELSPWKENTTTVSPGSTPSALGDCRSCARSCSAPSVVSMKRRVMGACGRENTSYSAPRSTISPFSITATSVQISLTTAISWVMMTMVMPSSRFRSFSSRRMSRVV